MTLSFEAARALHKPAAAVTVRPKGTDLEVFAWEKDGKFFARGFVGRQTKPIFAFRFATAARRESYVLDVAKGRRERAERKVAQKETAKAVTRDLKIGDILVCSWGYSMTIVDFFSVVGFKGKTMVQLRAIAKESTGGMTGHSTPIPGQYIGEAFARFVKGDSVKIDDRQYASKWNGKPAYYNSLD